MPLVPVDNTGDIVLFYEDSGIPGTSTQYTTLVLIHGITYHSGIFEKLLPFAPSHNLRLIRINQRDYPPSSLYTTSDIQAFASPERDIQSGAIADRGQEIASLLLHLIGTLHLPPKSVAWDGKVVGGISVLGWSLGAFLPLSLLANASTLANNVQLTLGNYLRSIVLFDPAMIAIGEPVPPIFTTPDHPKGLYWPLLDESLPFDKRTELGDPWMSSYYTPIEDISSATLETLAERSALQDLSEDAFSKLGVESWKRTPTLERIPLTKLAELSYIDAAARLWDNLGKVDLSIYEENLRVSLGIGGDASSLTWPECKVVLVSCDMTIVDCAFASAQVVRLLNKESHCIGRKTEVARLAGANHFVVWDEPEKAIALLARLI